MAVLSGGGNFVAPQKFAVGESLSGIFVSYERDVPSEDPRFGPQDILTLEVDGQIKKVGANASVKRTLRNNPQVLCPGRILKLTFKGEERTKKGIPFKRVEVEDMGMADAFPPAANEPMAEEEDDVGSQIAAARARRAA